MNGKYLIVLPGRFGGDVMGLFVVATEHVNAGFVVRPVGFLVVRAALDRLTCDGAQSNKKRSIDIEHQYGENRAHL